jgi:hypothetical protein
VHGGSRGRAAVVVALAFAALTACGASMTPGRGSPDGAQLPAPVESAPSHPSSPASVPPPPAPPSPSPSPSVAGRPCPSSVAATLPGGRGAVLVAGYETRRFRIYYCRSLAGTLYYRGISKSAPAQAVTIPATRIPGGYEARRTVDGSTFVYRVTAGRLLVTQDGRTILTDSVVGTL